MRLVKVAVAGLMAASTDRREEVAVVAFRGASAEVVAEPTRNSEAVRQALESLPTGGRTPLSHGLKVALRYVTYASILAVLTDGGANVPSKSDDVWADALDAARQFRRPALVIDEDLIGATGRPAGLAGALRARHIKMETLSSGEELLLTLRKSLGEPGCGTDGH